MHIHTHIQTHIVYQRALFCDTHTSLGHKPVLQNNVAVAVRLQGWSGLAFT